MDSWTIKDIKQTNEHACTSSQLNKTILFNYQAQDVLSYVSLSHATYVTFLSILDFDSKWIEDS